MDEFMDINFGSIREYCHNSKLFALFSLQEYAAGTIVVLIFIQLFIMFLEFNSS